mgnify:CR=1 FL=1
MNGVHEGHEADDRDGLAAHLRAAEIPFVFEFADPETFARGLASTGPAYEAIQSIGEEEGARFIRTGDVGKFDEDGFVVLGDRKKDMIITGGFNVYPSDLEAELAKHPAVAESADRKSVV